MQKNYTHNVAVELLRLFADLFVVIMIFILINAASSQLSNSLFLSQATAGSRNPDLSIVDYFDMTSSDKEFIVITPLNKKIAEARRDIRPPVLVRVASVSISKQEAVKSEPEVKSTSITKNTPTMEPISEVQTVALLDIQEIIVRYANEYGVDANKMINIAKCESGFNPNAVNGPYAGLYQFLASTWQSNRNAMGLNPDITLRYNAEEAIKTAAFKMSRDGYGAWPVCSR